MFLWTNKKLSCFDAYKRGALLLKSQNQHLRKQVIYLPDMRTSEFDYVRLRSQFYIWSNPSYKSQSKGQNRTKQAIKYINLQ